jgi:4-hydroxy-tetrahydrodipicolinate reductase
MRIGVTGCAGRMGRLLVQTIRAHAGLALAGGTEAPGHPAIGRDLGDEAGIGALGLPIGGDAAALFAASDVVVDFTLPEATAAHAAIAARAGTALVCGTTGLSADDRAALAAAATAVPVVYAANFSIGVNILIGLTARIAGVLGTEFDIEIVEMHHRMKVDAPSGTALALGEAAARARGADLDVCAVRARDGRVGPRPPGAIGFATLRGGDVVGEHTIVFAGPGERIELTHKAGARTIFAAGAVRAARWTAGHPPGLYGMADVLGLS